MPGRGRPWREGGHVDDTILGEDIKDGTIQEVDLDSALQAKVNSGGHTIQDEGTPITDQSNLNFIGAGVTAVFGAEDTTTVTIPGGIGHIIEDEGTPLIDRPDLNFVGAGVTVTDDGEGAKTVVTIPSGADGVGYDEVQDEGTPLVKRLAIDFKGAGVTVTDDGELTKTIVTIPGGVGGGIAREDIADPFTDFYFYDEFFYPRPNTEFPHFEKSVSSINASSQAVGGEVTYNTTAVANNIARINICGAGLQVVDSSKRLIMKCRVQLPNASVATNGLMVGFFTPQTDGPGGTFPFSNKVTNGLGFLLDGAGNIKTYSDDNITPEETDSGVAQDNLMHTYEIDFDPAGTPTITYKIDGNIVKSQTTNLPSFNGAWYCNGQTSDAVTKAVRIDTLFIFNER